MQLSDYRLLYTRFEVLSQMFYIARRKTQRLPVAVQDREAQLSPAPGLEGRRNFAGILIHAQRTHNSIHWETNGHTGHVEQSPFWLRYDHGPCYFLGEPETQGEPTEAQRNIFD
jgi:hypothetical protein